MTPIDTTGAGIHCHDFFYNIKRVWNFRYVICAAKFTRVPAGAKPSSVPSLNKALEHFEGLRIGTLGCLSPSIPFQGDMDMNVRWVWLRSVMDVRELGLGSTRVSTIKKRGHFVFVDTGYLQVILYRIYGYAEAKPLRTTF